MFSYAHKLRHPDSLLYLYYYISVTRKGHGVFEWLAF